MRVIGLTAILGVAVTAAVLFLWVKSPAHPQQSPRLAPPASGAAPSDGSNATNETTPAVSVTTTNRSNSADGVSVDALLASITRDPLPKGQADAVAITSLLSQNSAEILPKDVPILDATSELDLIDRYRRSEGFVERRKCVHLLALGGGDAAFQLFTNIVLHEFGGKAVDADGNSLLMFMPIYLGLMSRHQDRAFQFLMAGIQKQLPLTQGLWTFNNSAVLEHQVRERLWQGLALSGRLEFRELLSSIRDSNGGDITRGMEAAIVDSAHYFYALEHYGLDELMGSFIGLETRYQRFAAWMNGTEDGKAWAEWRRKNDSMFIRESSSVPANR